MANLLVTQREKKLLFNSNIIKSYENIYSFINDNPRKKDVDLKYEQTDIQSFFLNTYDKVLKQASEEWMPDSQDPVFVLDDHNKIRCQLCNRPIKNVCKITNKITNAQLKIGTECVKHFGMDSDISIDELLEKSKKIKRHEKITSHFPSIEKDIVNWPDYLENLHIVIPHELENPYLVLGENIKNYYNEFINKKTAREDFVYIKNIKSTYDEVESVYKKINTYVNTNSGCEFIASKNIASWLRHNNKNKVLEEIKKTGKIAWSTSLHVQEPNFTSLIISKYNEYFRKSRLNFRINELLPNKGFLFQFLNSHRVQGTINYYDFMLDNGGVIFNKELDKPLSEILLLNSMKLYGEKSLETIIYLLSKKSETYGIFVRDLNEDIDYQTGDIYLYIKDENSYIILNLFNTAEKFKDLALGYENKTIQDYFDYISDLNLRKYNKKDIEGFKEIKKDLY